MNAPVESSGLNKVLSYGFGLAVRGVVKVVRAAEYVRALTASPAEKNAAFAAAAKRIADHKWRTDSERECASAVSDYILSHPKGVSKESLEAAGVQDVPMTMFKALNWAEMNVNRLLVGGDENFRVRLEPDGMAHASDGHSENVKEEVAKSMGLGDIRNNTPAQNAQVDAVWNAIYKLASSGQAEHLFEGVLLEKSGGVLVAKDNPGAFYGNPGNLFDGWKLDKEAAVAQRSARLPSFESGSPR